MAERKKLRERPRGSGDVRIQSEGAHEGTPDAAHELTDARVGPLFRFLAGLALLLAVTLIAVSFLMWSFLRRADRAEPPRHPLASLRETPPEPRLQTLWGVDERPGHEDATLASKNQRTRLERLEGVEQSFSQHGWVEHQAEDERVLGSYGWIDAQNGVVRIPIERAMELVLEHGLPVAPGADAPKEPSR
jgi:hypothetical protein